jgi:hypothetical protein
MMLLGGVGCGTSSNPDLPSPPLSATEDELTIVGEQQSYKICRQKACHDGAMVDFVSLPRTEDLTLAWGLNGIEHTCSSKVGLHRSCGGAVVRALPLDMLPMDRKQSVLLDLEGTPPGVWVSLRSGDEVLFEPSYVAFSYETYTPNGADCPPTCEIAKLTIDGGEVRPGELPGGH